VWHGAVDWKTPIMERKTKQQKRGKIKREGKTTLKNENEKGKKNRLNTRQTD